MRQPRELYRHFNAAGRLLYVGVTISAVVRTSDHSRLSHWFDQITRIEIERFDTLEAALAAESRAIVNESPLYNKIVSGSGNGGRPRIGDSDKTLAATKPWVAQGFSRSTWFRRRPTK